MLFRLACIPLLFVTSASSDGETGKITVIVQGIRGSGGFVRVGLWNAAEGFPSTEKLFARGTAEVHGDSASVELDNIPAGIYAASAYHDENDNHKLDTNRLHIPTEGYGFSNAAQSRLGPPSFQSAAFHFSGGADTIMIRIRYLFEHVRSSP
jgi:uncharacterized protein (DUF2141 family)